MSAVLDVVAARRAAAEVLDPEVPVLTVDDLGVLREVSIAQDGAVEVAITPTYSGCPAMETIAADIRCAVRDAGFDDVRVRTVLSPAWTTDWMSDAGRRKLAEYGIAPPSTRRGGPVRLQIGVRRGSAVEPPRIACPQCGSADVREQSHFGSTACKSLWQCMSCREPFDYFKAI